MAHLSLSFLGTFQVLQAKQPITHFRSSNVRGLLVFLALQADRPFTREVLATLLWPDEDEQTAYNNLRQILYRLRKALNDTDETKEPYLLITRQTVQFNPNSDFDLDVRQFSQAVKQRDCETAVALYQGDLLPGFTCDSLEFEEWLRQERESLHHLAMEAFSELAEKHLHNGRLEEAQAAVRKQLTLEPWREAAHRQLMRILADMGDRGGALAQYELCRQQLWDELAVEPISETETLYQEIKAGRYGRTAEERQAAPVALSNLPQETTPLIGREAELQQLRDLLMGSQQRLLTIVGVGGMGKTRLSLAFASQPELYGAPQHGVAFVPLAPLNDPTQIVSAVADALQFSLSSGTQSRNSQEQLFDYLRRKEMLLVLDNFEHLLAGAGVVSELLQNAPQLRIVVTSRERLQLQEEQVYPIQGLSFPEPTFGQFTLDTETVRSYTAVQLFTQTAQRVQPHFNLQHEDLSALLRICHLLSGMPLAVELAAGWADMLSVAEIAAEIERNADFLETDVRNVPTRHRSMRAVFEASWQRLTDEEQLIFAQLTIFQGGFTRQAGQSVTNASLRLLGRLVNKSLVHYDHTHQRYQIHELLRQYGAEQLAQNEEQKTAVAHQHSHYYATFLHQQTAQLKSQHQQTALTAIEGELGNIRIAWGWAIAQREFEHLFQALDALRLFYDWKGQYQASEEMVKEVITELPNPATSTEQHLLAKALIWQASVCQARGNYERSKTLLTQSQTFLDTLTEDGLDVRPEQIEHLLLMGQAAANTDHKQAKALYQQAYGIAESLANAWYQARSLRYWGMTEYSWGQYETAEERLQQALSLAQQTGDLRLQARILDELSQLAVQLAQFTQAEQYVRQGYAIYHSFADSLSIALGTGKLGIILVHTGKVAEAETLLAQSLSLFKDLGNENWLAQSYIRLGIAQTNLGKLTEADTHMNLGVKLYRQLGNHGLTGWALWGLGGLLLATAEFEKAQQIFIESNNLLEQAGQLDMASWSLGYRGLTASFLGQEAEAKELLKQGLQSGNERREYLTVLASVAGIMLLYAQNGKQERAAELYGLLNSYPFFAVQNKGCPVQLSKVLQPFLAQLPADTLQTAEANGQKLDLWQTAAALLNELSSEDK